MLVVCYFAFPREIEVLQPFPVNPTAAEVADVVENIAPIDSAQQAVGNRQYQCHYWDDSGSTDDTAEFTASLIWCLRDPEAELPPPGTTGP